MTTEEMKTAQEELSKLFATIQRLDAPMTENNVAVMHACLGSIKFVFELIAKGVEKIGNADAE